jgi:hypothetical protein
MPRFNEPFEPVTLGNMRANGVRSLDVCCWQCRAGADLRAAHGLHELGSSGPTRGRSGKSSSRGRH